MTVEQSNNLLLVPRNAQYFSVRRGGGGSELVDHCQPSMCVGHCLPLYDQRDHFIREGKLRNVELK